MSWGMQQQNSSQRNDLLASIANDEAIQSLIREASGPVVAAATQQNGTVFYNTHAHTNTPPPPPPQQQQQQQQQYYFYQQQLQGGYNGAVHNAAAAAVVQQQFYGYQPNLAVYPVMPQQFQPPPPPPPPALHHSLNGRQPYARQYYMKRNSSTPSFRRNSGQYPSQSTSFNRRTLRASHSRKQSRDNKFNVSQQSGKEEGIEMIRMEKSASTTAVTNLSGTDYERYDFDSEKTQANAAGGVVQQPPLQKSEIDDEQTDIVIVDLSNQVKNQSLEKPINEVDLTPTKNEGQVGNIEVENKAQDDTSKSCAVELPADLEIENMETECVEGDATQTVLENGEKSSQVQEQDDSQFVGLSTACAENLPADLDVTDEVVIEQEEVHASNEAEEQKQNTQLSDSVENKDAVQEEVSADCIQEPTQSVKPEVTEKCVEAVESEGEQMEAVNMNQEEQICAAVFDQVQSSEESMIIHSEQEVQGAETVEEYHQDAVPEQKICSDAQDENNKVGEDIQEDDRLLQKNVSYDAFGLQDNLSVVATGTKVGDLAVAKSQSIDTLNRSSSVEDVLVGRSQSHEIVATVSDTLPEASPKKSEQKKKGWFSGLLGRGKKNKNKNSAAISQDNAAAAAAALSLQVEEVGNHMVGSDSSSPSVPETLSDAAPVQEEQQVDTLQNPPSDVVVNEVGLSTEQEAVAQQSDTKNSSENIDDDAKNLVRQNEQEVAGKTKKRGAIIPLPPPLPPKRIDRSHPGDVSTIASRFNIPDKPVVPKLTKTTSYLKNDAVGVNMGMRRASTMTRKTSIENNPPPPPPTLTKINSVNSTNSSTHSSQEEQLETEICEENRIQKLMKGWKQGAPVKAKALGEEDLEEEIEQVAEKQLPLNAARKLPPKNENISSIRDRFKAQEQSFLQKRAQKMGGTDDVCGVKGAVRKFDVPPPKPLKNASFGEALSKFKEESKLSSPK